MVTEPLIFWFDPHIVTLQMSNRGYEVILVRDCTTGMESRNTEASLSQTAGAVRNVRTIFHYFR